MVSNIDSCCPLVISVVSTITHYLSKGVSIKKNHGNNWSVNNQDKESNKTYGRFAERLAAPDRRRQSPEIRIRDGRAEPVLTDSRGEEVSFAPGSRVHSKNFENLELSALFLQGVVFIDCVWTDCNLRNTEFKDCEFEGCSFLGGAPGFVVNQCRVTSCLFEDPEGVLRFVRSELEGVIISGGRIALEFNRCVGTGISIQHAVIGAPSRVIRSDINELRIINAQISEVLFARSSFFNATICNSDFERCLWIDAQLECAEVSEMSLSNSMLSRVNFDGATIRRIVFHQCLGQDLTFWIASIMAFEAVATRLSNVRFDRTSIDGCAFWRSNLAIEVNDSAVRGFRFNDGSLDLIGEKTIFDSPVLRRSFIDSRQVASIKVLDPDISSSNQITAGAAKWLNKKGGTHET